MEAQFVTRAYNNIKNTGDGCIFKKSSNNKIVNEINYFINLPEVVKPYFPEYVSSDLSGDVKTLKLKYIDGRDLGYHLTNKQACEQLNWETIINKLIDSVSFFKSITKESTSIEKDKRLMFIDKTYNEFLKFSKRDHTKWLTSQETLNVNGRQIKNFKLIWKDIKKLIEDIPSVNHSFIHGDLCFANILFSRDKNLYFVDPRGSYGTTRYCYGDYRYDYAKLLHSIEGGYEFIIRDKFKLHNLNFTLENYTKKDELLSIFKSKINKEDYAAARIIQGLIYIGMCDRHYDSHDRQRIMYCTGIQILNDLLT